MPRRKVPLASRSARKSAPSLDRDSASMTSESGSDERETKKMKKEKEICEECGEEAKDSDDGCCKWRAVYSKR